MRGDRRGVIADEKHVAVRIAADDDADVATEPLEEIPDLLARKDLRELEGLVADLGDEFRRDAVRLQDALDDLLVGHAVEIAVLVDVTAARGVPSNSIALQHGAVAVGVIGGLSRQDDAGNGEETAQVDR